MKALFTLVPASSQPRAVETYCISNCCGSRVIQTASLPLKMNSFSVANLRDMLENQTLPGIVLIKKQYRVFEESNFCRFQLLKPPKCPNSDSLTLTSQPCQLPIT